MRLAPAYIGIRVFFSFVKIDDDTYGDGSVGTVCLAWRGLGSMHIAQQMQCDIFVNNVFASSIWNRLSHAWEST